MTPHHRLRTVLVTGGCGFIGSHLIRHLLGSDPQVVVVNLDALTYAGIPERLAEVASAHASRYRFLHGDVCDDQLVERIFQEHGPDTVIHLAAESHVDRAISGPDRFMRTNVLGTMTLLKAAHFAWQGRTDVRFHQVSTDEVFGSLPSAGLFTESLPYRPSNPYSATKAAADHLVQAWHHTYGLPVTISYGTNTYGPQQFPEKLIPLAITRALAGQPIPLYGDGQHIRDWMYVDDHVRGIEAIVRTAETGGRFLVGSHQELTNRDLLERLCRVLDQQRPRHSGAKYRDLMVSAADRPGHDRRYASDTSHLRATLGWRAEVGIDEGLLRTVRWHVEQTGTEGDAVLK